MLRAILLKRPAAGRMRQLLTQWLYLALALGSGVALAAVSQTPLFLAQPPKPNVMFTLDNSGSMEWETVTGVDALGAYNTDKTNRAFYSSAYNQIYYDPATTYIPGTDYLSASMGSSPPSAARIDPYPTTGGNINSIDLTVPCYAQSTPTLPIYSKTISFAKNSNCPDTANSTNDKKVARYAFYYAWKGSGSPDGSTGQNTDANYTRVDILSGNTYAKASTRTDCGAGPCTYTQEIQNFANWFTYYRTRILMTKTSIGLAFSLIDPIVTPVNPSKLRVGFNAINKSGSSNTSVTDGVSWLTIRDFDKDQKQSFYTKLYAFKCPIHLPDSKLGA